MPTDRRTATTILAEIAEVRRYLHEAPPHHDGGTQALRRRLTDLEAELAATRREVRSPTQHPDQRPDRRPDPPTERRTDPHTDHGSASEPSP